MPACCQVLTTRPLTGSISPLGKRVNAKFEFLCCSSLRRARPVRTRPRPIEPDCLNDLGWDCYSSDPPCQSLHQQYVEGSARGRMQLLHHRSRLRNSMELWRRATPSNVCFFFKRTCETCKRRLISGTLQTKCLK